MCEADRIINGKLVCGMDKADSLREKAEKIAFSHFLCTPKCTNESVEKIAEILLEVDQKARRQERERTLEQAAEVCDVMAHGYLKNHCAHCEDGSAAAHNAGYSIRSLKSQKPRQEGEDE